MKNLFNYSVYVFFTLYCLSYFVIQKEPILFLMFGIHVLIIFLKALKYVKASFSNKLDLKRDLPSIVFGLVLTICVFLFGNWLMGIGFLLITIDRFYQILGVYIT